MEEKPTKKKKKKKGMTDRETYNAVSDTVTGANFRWKDNLIQGAVVGGVSMVSAVVGFIVGGTPLALVCLLLGLVVSVIGTGVFLMIYRAIKHARGDHD